MHNSRLSLVNAIDHVRLPHTHIETQTSNVRMRPRPIKFGRIFDCMRMNICPMVSVVCCDSFCYPHTHTHKQIANHEKLVSNQFHSFMAADE